MFTRDIRTRVLVHRSETPSFAGCMCINSHLPRYDIQWCRIWRSMDLFPIVGRGRPHGTLSCRHHVLHTCLVASTSHRRQLVSAHLTLTMLGNISSSRAASAAAGSSRGTTDPRSLVRLGMQKFVAGHVEASIEDFDAALALDPSIHPYLWQRGLSLYYVGTEQALRDAALQFRCA